GFLLACMPAPALIRRLVPRQHLNAMLGVWGAYMPFGTALALLGGPAWMALGGWEGWWWLLAGVSGVMAVWIAIALPRGPVVAGAGGWLPRIRETLVGPGPWMVAATFGAYSAQWLSL